MGTGGDRAALGGSAGAGLGRGRIDCGRDGAMRLLAALRERPGRISVRTAWLEHERYRGRRIAIRGTIGVFETGTPHEYFVLDDGPHRIGLRGPAALVATFRGNLGRPVRVTGWLTFKPGVGIFLEAKDLRCR